MALFLDRHEMNGSLDGITPEEVAKLHATDLDVEDRYGVRCLTYWYQLGSPVAYCLFLAPTADAAVAVHRDAHGNLPTNIIEVDWRNVETFMGPVRGPERGEAWQDIARRFFMCTDVDYPRSLMQGSGTRTLQALADRDVLAAREVSARGGRYVGVGRRGVIGCFLAGEAALESALAVQKSVGPVSLLYQETPFQARIGITVGEPVYRKPGLFEAALDEAAEICDRAEPGSILVSAEVVHLCRDKGFEFTATEEEVHGNDGDSRRLYRLAGHTDRSHATPNQWSSARAAAGGLSRRQVEVLQLIVAGKTNQEIADQLFVSLNTVATHVRNIFGKIEASNRAEAAAYALRHDLA